MKPFSSPLTPALSHPEGGEGEKRRSPPSARFAVLTVSDRASRGEYADETGPAVRRFLEQRGWSAAGARIAPDEVSALRDAVSTWLEEGVDLIVAAGGTGVAPRDVTPEALRPLLDKELPGFGELMRAEGLKKTRKAALSRSFAGSRGKSLLIAVPGSPRGAVESLAAVADLIPSVISLLRGEPCA